MNPEKKIPSLALFIQGVRHYERELLRGIADYAKLHGPWQFYRNVPYLFGQVADPEALIQGWQPDALIIRESSPHRYDELLKSPLPLIYSPTTECSPKVSNIVVDDLAVGRLAAEHLHQAGLRHFAYCGVQSFFWSRLRGEGFAARIRDYGSELNRFETEEGREFFSWDPSHGDFASWLKQLPKPIGIFCCTDDFALLVQEACLTADLHIPEEVALIGVGNDESICDLAQVSISSVQLNIRRGGYDAAHYLAGCIASGKKSQPKPHDVVIEAMGIAVRPSTDAAQSRDSEVAKAIAYIRKNLHRKLNVEDVVREVSVSRRRLYDRFKAVTGMSLFTYIQDRRLEAFARMLLETELTVAEIAYALGEHSEKNVARPFKARYGMSPVAYREKHQP
ncbi:MAG: substrate-binding domain-containing protein [Opitutales bacterium]